MPVLVARVSCQKAWRMFTNTKSLALHHIWLRTSNLAYGGRRGAGVRRSIVPPYSCVFSSFTNVGIQRLKSALWFSIGKIVDEETLKLGVNATPHFIGALTEMVWAQIGKLQLPLTARIRAHADMNSR